MDEKKVILSVTREKFDENFSIDDWFNFGQITQGEMYKIMLNFVVNEAGEYVSTEDARKLFKNVKKADWVDYVNEFAKSINDAFVDPTSGDS